MFTTVIPHSASNALKALELLAQPLIFATRFLAHRQEDGWRMVDGVPLQILARCLSLPSLRKMQAKTISSAPGCSHQESLDKTQEQQGGSSVDDLHFLDYNECGPGGDGLVAVSSRQPNTWNTSPLRSMAWENFTHSRL